MLLLTQLTTPHALTLALTLANTYRHMSGGYTLLQGPMKRVSVLQVSLLLVPLPLYLLLGETDGSSEAHAGISSEVLAAEESPAVSRMKAP